MEASAYCVRFCSSRNDRQIVPLGVIYKSRLISNLYEICRSTEAPGSIALIDCSDRSKRNLSVTKGHKNVSTG